MSTADFDFDSYSELALQRFMVLDRARTDAFAAGIKEVVRQGDRVIDVGAGSGLLAMLAAKAGASTVYGLERAAIAQVARTLAKRNGLENVVEILHENASQFESTEKVDLIVSEWLGNFAFTEGMLQHVIACREKNLRPGGRMLPSHVDLLLAPLESSELYEQHGPGSWNIQVDGLDFSSLEKVEVEQAIATKTLLAPDSLLAPAQSMVGLDLAKAKEEDIWQAGQLTFVAKRDGLFHGFGGWFTAQLSPSVCLDTGPEQTPTHWEQTYFARHPERVQQGENLDVKYALHPHPVSSGCLELELTFRGQRMIHTIT